MLRLGMAVLLGSLITGSACAQQRAQVTGAVRDPSSATIPGASVSLTHLESGIRRQAQTNSQGFYSVFSLAAGTYKVTVRKEGFRTTAQMGVVLEAVGSARLDFVLSVGSMHETVTVESSTPLLNTEDLASTLVLNATRARSLPLNGRALQGFIDLAPGVLTTPATGGEAGQFSANGQRPNTNYFTVDGLSANNGVMGGGLPGQFSGGTLPAMTAVGSLHNLAAASELEEVRIQTSTFAPEFGRLPGAQVAVTTRGGSNDFHGDFLGSWRDRRLAAANWFANRAGNATNPIRLSQLGGSLSGPIQHNRLFFLVATEWLRARNSANYLTTTPSLEVRRELPQPAAALLRAFPNPTGQAFENGTGEYSAAIDTPGGLRTTSARVDRVLGEHGTTFFRYADSRSDSTLGLLQRNRTDFSAQSATGALISVFGATTNDARINVSKIQAHSSWLPNPGAPDLSSILPDPGPGQKLFAIYIPGLSQLIQGEAGTSQQWQMNLLDTLAFSTGRHNLRLGIDYQRLSPSRDAPIASILGSYESLLSMTRGGWMNVSSAFVPSGSSRNETLSLFVQDTWHLTPRLNLTYGLRWELTPAPAYQNLVGEGFTSPNSAATSSLAGTFQRTPIWKNRFDQFAPRFGLAYRLNREGTWVLRAGAGFFYDLGFSSAVDLINGSPYNRWNPSGLPAMAQELSYGFAPDLRLPKSFHWNVTLERAISSSMSFSTAYIGSSGSGLLRREATPNPVTGATNLVIATNHGGSNYQSAQAQFRSRLRRGVNGVVSYSWSHSIDNGSWDSASFLVLPGRSDRGSSTFDVRHSASAALVWNLPQRLSLTKNWTLSGIWRARSGFPIDVLSQDNPLGLGFENGYRPSLNPGVAIWINDPDVPGGKKLNRAAFALGNGQGALGRNSLNGFGLSQIDLAVQRAFSLGERGTISFRAEAVNVLNQVSFSDPVRFLSSGLFGRSVSTADLMLGTGRPQSGLAPMFQSGGPRSVQLGLTLRF